MNKATQISHPLINRSGTSQRTRIISALNTKNAPIDGSTLADRLHKISLYAQQINFYEYVNNNIDGEYQNIENWSAFFNTSLPFLLANFGKISITNLENEYKLLFEELNNSPSKQALESLLIFVFNKFIAPVDALYSASVENKNNVTNPISSIVEASFLKPLKAFISTYNASAIFLCVTKKSFNSFLKAPWKLEVTDIYAYNTEIQKSTTKKEGYLIAGKAVNTLFNTLLGGLNHIVQIAPNYIEEALYPLEENLQKKHSPHVALLFTFLELFKHFQNDLNLLTKKHLDFFYQQVLKFTPKKAVQDKAHIVFEIAKHLDQYLIKENTLLKNGKDVNNEDIIFGLNNDIVIDKAQIKDLKTLFLNNISIKDNSLPKFKKNTKNKPFIESVNIAPIANSTDGLGASFNENETPNWPTLGSKYSKLSKKDDEISNEETETKCLPEEEPYLEYPKARLGFILSSSVLFLQEGKRTITITLECSQPNNNIFNFNALDKKTLFNISFSGEKQWQKVPEDRIIKVDFNTASTSLTIIIQVELLPDFPAIVFYDEEKLEEKLDLKNNYPLVKVELNTDITIPKDTPPNYNYCSLENNSEKNQSNQVSLYQFFQGIIIINTNIAVKVCGIKNLIVQNDENLQDVNKPIQPFGTRPKVGSFYLDKNDKKKWFVDGGSNFYIGSKEIFCKNWQKFWINTTWKDKPLDLEKVYRYYKGDEDESASFEDGSTVIKNESFRFLTSVLHDGKWIKDSVNSLQPVDSGTPPSGSKKELLKLFFDEKTDDIGCENIANKATFHHQINVPFFEDKSDYTPKSMPTDTLTPLDVNTRKGFIKLTLAGVSFQHDRYTYVLTRQMMALAGLVDPESIKLVQNDLEKSGILCTSARGKVDSIYSSINTIIDGSVDTINTNITDIITCVETDIPNITADITTLTNEIESHANAIINRNIDTLLKGKITTVSNSITAIIDELKNNTQSNPGLKKIAEDLESDLDTIKGDYENSEAFLNSDAIPKVASIVSKIGDTNQNTSLLGKISTLKTDLDDVNTEIDTQIGFMITQLGSIKTKATTGIDDKITDLNEKATAIKTKTETIQAELDIIFKKLESIRDAMNSNNSNDSDVSIADDVIENNQLSDYGIIVILKDLCRRIQNVTDGLSIETELGLPQEPYTPEIKTLSIDYEAVANKDDMDIIHLYPFENTSKYENIEENPTLLPLYEDNGTLFIGIENITPGGTLSILFQLAEATANSEMPSAKLNWYYLKNNNWTPLQLGLHIISDETNGLTTSGIVTIAIPKDINKIDNTLMSSSLHWIKVTTTNNAKAVAEAIGIHTQAVKTFAKLSELNDKNRLNTGLQENSINKLVESNYNVKKVQQFYPSFGGEQPEENGHFYTRVSEHLKHKGRALHLKDFETLVLERFAEIYKVKCISHTMGLSSLYYKRDLEVAPGYIVLTVIPDLTKLLAGNSLEPKAPVSLLKSIANYLRKKMSASARLKVLNPRYEKVDVDIAVRLYRGKDQAYYEQQLKEDITNFLAPWYLGESEKIAFGMPVIYSDVVGFVEQLPYVDFITKLILGGINGQTGSIIKPLTARSILTAGLICVNIDSETCLENPNEKYLTSSSEVVENNHSQLK